MKAGEGNPQAREEEGKTEFIRHRAQLISGWNSWNMGIGIPWESHCFHFPLNSFEQPLLQEVQSGKTTLVKHLIREKVLNYHKIYLICSTANLQDEYSFLPRQVILPVSEDSINKVVKEQERNPKQRVLLVLDDFVGKLRFQSSDLIDHLALSCRHY